MIEAQSDTSTGAEQELQQLRHQIIRIATGIPKETRGGTFTTRFAAIYFPINEGIFEELHTFSVDYAVREHIFVGLASYLYRRYHRWLVAAAILLWCISGTSHPVLASENSERLSAYQPRPIAIPPGAGYLTETGKIRVVGYNDMQNMLSGMTRVFTGFHPGMDFELILEGTRTAPPALAGGTSLFAPMGAEFEESALARYRKTVGSDPVLFRVAHASLSPKALSGPLFYFVNRANTLQHISMPDARRILTASESIEPITRWGQLGLEGEWQDLPILPCGVAGGSALANYLQKHHLGEARFAATFTGFKQSADAVEFGAKNPAAFCFASYNRHTDEVKPLAISIEEGQAPVAISEASVVNGSYPLDRHLLIYTRQTACGAIDPLAAEFLNLMLSEPGQSIIATTPEGYLPLNINEIREEKLRLAEYSKCNGMREKTGEDANPAAPNGW